MELAAALDRAAANLGDTTEGVVLDNHGSLGSLAEQNGKVAGALSLAQPLSYESIAVEDSRNVQIGNNIHIYGEVTLVLPASEPEPTGLPAEALPDPGLAELNKTTLQVRFWQRPCFRRAGVGLATLAAVVLTVALASPRETEAPQPEAESYPGLVTRSQWNATTVRVGGELLLPVKTVAVHHTLTMACTDRAECTKQVSWLQLKALSNDDDIPYNLLVGGDGLVYEGRGWGAVGATLPDWDSKVLSLALIGNFDHVSPTEQQRAALASLLQWGVSNGKVDKAYRLAGACQLREYEYFNDTSPGVLFMAELQTWDHWWDFVVRQFQNLALDNMNMSDIGYNFLVGGDGLVYLGRGWDGVGAHTLLYNNKSIGVAAIGRFTFVTAPPALQNALLRLLQWGVRLGKLTEDYRVVGHCQLRPDSDSPGSLFMQDLRTWSHWSSYTAVPEACTT